MGQFAWGENNAGSNIYSGRTPAFPRLELAMDPAPWFRFSYVHGALISEVVDSTLSFYTSTAYGDDYREVYHPKYVAANIFTFTPIKGLQLSIGNSVIYDYRYPAAAFLLPVAFYKAIDHTLNAGINNMNSQLFFSASLPVDDNFDDVDVAALETCVLSDNVQSEVFTASDTVTGILQTECVDLVVALLASMAICQMAPSSMTMPLSSHQVV